MLVDVGLVQRRRPPLGDESHGRHGQAVGHSEAGGWGGQNVCGRTHASGESFHSPLELRTYNVRGKIIWKLRGELSAVLLFMVKVKLETSTLLL